MTTTIRQHYDRLNANRVQIEIPEWNKTIYVGPLTIGQYLQIDLAETPSERNIALLVVCAKDEKGERAFNAEEAHDLKLYGQAELVGATAVKIVEAHNSFADETEDTDEKKD